MTNMDWLKEAIDYGVIGLLLLLSILVVAVLLERAVFFARVKPERYAWRSMSSPLGRASSIA